ncbi:C-C motif chemokine 25-like protein [Labeo rohita]|uniref:C-C motif chemokine 25-like protein n=1 Tax=Labeo rohita TaxID=84645 RepID=A0A498NJF8_LABRO|nr:C-C motif chemokine 25-like protein [Labeo rohita]
MSATTYMEKQLSTMKFQILIFILLLACMYQSVAQGSYENCCLKYADIKSKKGFRRHVEGYRIQEADGGCNIRAVVFTLKNKKMVCVEPNLPWVQEEVIPNNPK